MSKTIRITPGSTSQSVVVNIYKDDGTANATPLVYNSSNLAASYRRDNGTTTSITLATLASSTASYSSGGFVHISNGRYRLDLPDAAIAASADRVEIIIADAADIRPDPIAILLDAIPTVTSGRVAADVTYLNGTAYASAGLVTTVAAIKAMTDNLPAQPAQESSVTAVGDSVTTTYNALVSLAAKFTGITAIANWLRLLMRSGYTDATALSEINTGGTGAFDSSTDSLEATSGGGSSGSGDIAIDHDYGSTDAYRVLNSVTGEPVDDATISAYAGATAIGTPNAQTRTGSDGRWLAPLMLDVGAYTLVISKAGVIETATASITVTAD